jgi:NAD(P)-dependent dehydrogenase (short-subunit alcohol dehydrogenase family)
MAQPHSNEGLCVAIVGAAGAIGAACARHFANDGSQTAILDRDRPALEELAIELGATAIEVDVTDETSVREAENIARQALGRIDILVNCAGAFQAPVSAGELRLERWDLVVDVALKGTFLTCRTFAEDMLTRGSGAIVNIASVGGMRPLPLHAYGSAKAGVLSLTESLAAEWGPGGIRVNAVSPGFTETPGLMAGAALGLNLSYLSDSSALGRLVQPVEVARAVAFLASPAASAVTGVNLPVDCGWLVTQSWQAYGGTKDRTKSTHIQEPSHAYGTP